LSTIRNASAAARRTFTPRINAVPAASSASKIRLTAEEERIYRKVDGTRTVQGVIDSTGGGEFEVCRILFDLLGVEQATGIVLTENFAMLPAASVCGLYFANKEARYFAVSAIGRDQVDSYAARKGWPIAEVERWLSPVLAYDPARLSGAVIKPANS